MVELAAALAALNFTAKHSWVGPRCYLRLTAAISLAASTWTDVTWDNEVVDDLNAHSTSSNTQNIVVPAGITKCRITFYETYQNVSGGVRYSQLMKNSVTLENHIYSGNNESGNHFTTAWLTVAPGDVLKFQVNCGTSANALQGDASGGFGGGSYCEIQWDDGSN